MKEISAECLATLQKRSRQFKSKLVFDDFELTKAEELTFTHTSSTSAGLTFGTCAIGTGSFSLKKDEHDLDGKEFTAYIGVFVGADLEWINMGRYTVTNVDIEGIVKSITFEDCISKLDVPYKKEHDYPISARTMLSNICDICGVEFDASAIPESLQVTQDLYGTSCRNITKLIAQLIGTFVAVDTATNKVAFKWYTDNGISVSSSNKNLYLIDEPTFDKDFALGVISNYTGTETITSGGENSTNVMSIANPMITQTVLDSLYEQYQGFSYTGAEVEFTLGNPLIDTWDIISVEYKGKSARIPCMSVEHTFDGGFTTEIKSFVRNEDTAFEGELTQTMNEVKTRITIVDGKVESKVSKDDVISSINQSPEEVKIQAERITLSGETTFEDVSTTVNTVNSWKGETDTTKINGAEIETGSITAEQIDVENLFAEDIEVTGAFTAIAHVKLYPTQTELDRVYDHITTDNKIPDDEIYKYDLNNTGTINSSDYKLFKNLVARQVSIDEFDSIPQTEVAVLINPSDAMETITISGLNYWGTEVKTTIGIDKLAIPNIETEKITTTKFTIKDIVNMPEGRLHIANVTMAYFKSNESVQSLINLDAYNREAEPFETPQLIINYQGSNGTLPEDNPNAKIDLVPLVKGLKSNIQEQLDSNIIKEADNVTTDSATNIICDGGNVDTGFRIKRTDTDRSLLFGIGGSGTNRGIFDDYLQKWIIRVNADDKILCAGEAETAKALTSTTGADMKLSYTENNTTKTKTYTLGTDVPLCTTVYSGDGIYCDGNSDANSVNSISISDSDHAYVRLTVYCRFPYGLGCMDFPLDMEQESENTTWGTRQGGIILPTGDVTSNATRALEYRMNWRAEQTTSGWTFQITDTGYFNPLVGATISATDWENNITTARRATDYSTWHQRHAEGYCVYKIVAWTI